MKSSPPEFAALREAQLELVDLGDAGIARAAYFVRHYCRPGQKAQRRNALDAMARAVQRALAAGDDPEEVLYAVARGLYARGDPNFCL